jgi:hypothetical protein
VTEELVTPTWTTAEALEILAEQAAVAAHHLLGYAPTGSMAEVSARMVLDTINMEVRSALGEDMFDFCPQCGTSGGRAVMESSPAHARCLKGAP